MNARTIQLTLHKHERRLRNIEAAAEIKPDSRDLIELPEIRVFTPDALDKKAIQDMQAKTEAAHKQQMEEFKQAALAEMKAMQDRQGEAIKAAVAIALHEQRQNDIDEAAAAPKKAAPLTADDIRALLRAELVAQSDSPPAPGAGDSTAGKPKK